VICITPACLLDHGKDNDASVQVQGFSLGGTWHSAQVAVIPAAYILLLVVPQLRFDGQVRRQNFTRETRCDNMPYRNLWLVVWIFIGAAVSNASVVRTSVDLQRDFNRREAKLFSAAAHNARFTPVQGRTADCEAAQPPQALATPEPLMDGADISEKITVSFIVGTDGLVHSPLVLESATPAQDQKVLNAVRWWRYRPGLCNGAPVDSEAKVQFFSH
jgi:hypothetical protein